MQFADTVDLAREPDKQPAPYVEFEMRPKETRNKETGLPEYIDVPWVRVTSQGSRDTLERLAEDWIKGMEAHAEAGRIPRHWPHQYREALARFIKGEEIPVNGTAIKNWPVPSKSQRKLLEDLHVQTVEDLALANDETKGRLGMGANALVEAAKAWVAEQTGPGAMAAKLEAAMTENVGLKSRLESLEGQVSALLALVPKEALTAAPEKPSGVLKLET